MKNKYLIKTQKIQINGKFFLESGEYILSPEITFETYGSINEKKDNVILICHAFTGDAHAAFYHENDEKPGWWDKFIGYEKAIDLNKFFVICSNVLGGCKGTTGPSSINKETGKRYALSFPFITIKDMVKLQKKLLDYLGIEKLLSVIGGSMGGMQVLEWVATYPELIYSVIPISTTMKHSPQQIAFNEVARQAIILDPFWNNGNYYGGKSPDLGLSIARMTGHITYMSYESMEKKFSRKRKTDNQSFSINFEVENYLKYQVSNFIKRFDANSYLYLTKALDYFDISERLFINNTKNRNIKFLVISFKSDWLYPESQSLDLIKLLRFYRIPVTYCNIKSNYGHDSFLVDVEEETKLVKSFLDSVYKEVIV